MDINLNTPSLLFPAISLLMLAYTNRFLALAALIRSLHARYREAPDPVVLGQIANLRLRISLVRNMQFLGVVAILLSVLCMFLLFQGAQMAAKIVFGASLICLMFSLLFSLWEIQISVNALNLQLSNLEEECDPQRTETKRI